MSENATPTRKPRVRLSTNLGDIVVQLDGVEAPISTLNFIRYAESGFYDQTIFHRVIDGFMIQGGGYTPNMDIKNEGQRPTIKNEWRNKLTNKAGSIAMARLGGDPDSASSQFFINVANNDFLDQAQSDGAGYAVFGEVVEGQEVVDAIRTTRLGRHPKYPSSDPVTPVKPVIIESATVLDAFDASGIEG
ncbi:MAG TPA: peptidylprolyl isomerase [Candidatus Sumerlaeota bacterium]|nr:peptidylprolyl isomerase [Candidatus Sumerlaeota bacterium]